MKLFKYTIISMAALVAGGCASNSELRAVKVEAMQATDEANRTAEAALVAAREAKQIAQEANARSLRSEEMLNRGFKRSMYK